MHYSIGVIVYGKDESAARVQAEAACGVLSCKECQRHFDYVTIKGKPLKVGSKDARKAIADRMEWSRQGFLSKLNLLRGALAMYSNEQAYLQRHPPTNEDIRFLAHGVGEYVGDHIYLYDNDGEGIREPEHLRMAIEKWPTLTDKATREKLDSAGSVWLVLADAHS